jgi:hypothetical protein
MIVVMVKKIYYDISLKLKEMMTNAEGSFK